MNSVAASRSRLTKQSDLPSTSIADAVAAIARRELAPLAARDRRAARSIRPNCCGVSAMPAPGAATGRRMAQPICAAPFLDRGARRGLRRHRLHGVVPEHAGLVRVQFAAIRRWRGFADDVASGQDARRHRAFQSDEELLRHREAEIEGPQGRGRLCRARRAALGVESRPRPFLRHHLRGRGHARRDRDVPRRLLRSRRSRCSRASRSSRWTAPAPMACSSATSSFPTT